jgi:hypothetical protein
MPKVYIGDDRTLHLPDVLAPDGTRRVTPKAATIGELLSDIARRRDALRHQQTTLDDLDQLARVLNAHSKRQGFTVSEALELVGLRLDD